MKAVHSFWSKPMVASGNQKCGWFDEESHWCSWILSFMLAKNHFEDFCLVTDPIGKKILVDSIGLPYNDVRVEINIWDEYDAKLWVLGKLMAYRSMGDDSFIHLDGDVFLWKKPPKELLENRVFCQSPEEVEEDEIEGKGWGYYPKKFASKILTPPHKDWGSPSIKKVGCVGIVGGNKAGHIFKELSDSIFSNLVICQADYKEIFSGKDYSYIPMLLEQYLLGLIVEKNNLSYGYLFNESEGIGSPYDHVTSSNLGYTHLLAGSKKNPQLATAVKNIVKKRYSRYYTNVQNYLKHGLIL